MAYFSFGKKALLYCAIASVTGALQLPRHATLTSRQSVNETKYDFIIAGGGIAGLTVADRLTEDPNGSILKHPTARQSLNWSPSECPGH